MSPHDAATIAQSSDAGKVFSEILPWLLVLLGVVVTGAILVHLLRPSARSRDDGSTAGFTLHDLRKLRAKGELPNEEFERARAAMIEHVSRPTSENSVEEEDDPDQDSNE